MSARTSKVNGLDALRAQVEGRRKKGQPPLPLRVGMHVQTCIAGSDPRIWSPEHILARRNELRGVIVHVFPDGYAVKAEDSDVMRAMGVVGQESYYQRHELKLTGGVGQALYAGQMERWSTKFRCWMPNDFQYCHAENEKVARVTFAQNMDSHERVVHVAPVIGFHVEDAHGEKLRA